MPGEALFQAMLNGISMPTMLLIAGTWLVRRWFHPSTIRLYWLTFTVLYSRDPDRRDRAQTLLQSSNVIEVPSSPDEAQTPKGETP